MKEIDQTARYTYNMEWARPEDKLFVIGLTDFAQKAAGDVNIVNFPNIGDTFEEDEIFATVESDKMLTEVGIPMSGTIVEVNDELVNTPQLVNSSPYEKGWLVKIKPSQPESFLDLLSPEGFEQHIGVFFKK